MLKVILWVIAATVLLFAAFVFYVQWSVVKWETKAGYNTA